LNTNIYSYLETSGGQSFNIYLNVVHLWELKDSCFPTLVSRCSLVMMSYHGTLRYLGFGPASSARGWPFRLRRLSFRGWSGVSDNKLFLRHWPSRHVSMRVRPVHAKSFMPSAVINEQAQPEFLGHFYFILYLVQLTPAQACVHLLILMSIAYNGGIAQRNINVQKCFPFLKYRINILHLMKYWYKFLSLPRSQTKRWRAAILAARWYSTLALKLARNSGIEHGTTILKQLAWTRASILLWPLFRAEYINNNWQLSLTLETSFWINHNLRICPWQAFPALSNVFNLGILISGAPEVSF
jgi:hypothetical protein